MRFPAVTILLACVLLAGPAAAPPPDMADLVARLLPSVVSIASTDPITDKDSADEGDQASPPGPQGGSTPSEDSISGAATTVIPPPKAEEALGSGFIIDPAGFIVTNNHVIDGATSVTVTLNDGTILPATVVGQDRRGDLAVLKVHAGHPLAAVRFGDSARMRVGDSVLAIGNPFGLDQSASVGIISALHRDIGEGDFDDFIQTDATINRGNSGGPLFDMTGRVIGVNSAIYSPSGGSVGIGFAIPAAMAAPVTRALETSGRVARGWLGISSQEVTPQIQNLLKLPRAAGALVGRVSRGGPADQILRPGDVLVSLGGVSITDPRSLTIRTAQTMAGQTAKVEFWRNGEMLRAAITIAVPPPDPPPKVVPQARQPNIPLADLGLVIAPLAGPAGVPVVAVDKGGPAAKAGVVAGDSIQAIGPDPIGSATALQDRLRDLAQMPQAVATLLINGYNAAGEDPGPRWVPVRLTPPGPAGRNVR